MFEKHNKLTRISYWLLTINGLIGFALIGSILPQLTWNLPWISYVIVAMLCLILIFNTYAAYAIYKRNFKALKLCMWLYGVQIVGFETENWAFSLNFGMNASISWVYETNEITINLLAIVIFTLVFLSYRSINKLRDSDSVSSSVV